MKKTTENKNMCWDCKFAEYHDVYWNRNIETGIPITKHCSLYEKKGIMETQGEACNEFKHGQ